MIGIFEQFSVRVVIELLSVVQSCTQGGTREKIKVIKASHQE